MQGYDHVLLLQPQRGEQLTPLTENRIIGVIHLSQCQRLPHPNLSKKIASIVKVSRSLINDRKNVRSDD